MKNNLNPTLSASKPHILLLGSQMAVGGAQHVLLEQAGWLHEHGYPVTAAFLYDRDGLQKAWQAERDFPIIDLHFQAPGAGRLQKAFSLVSGMFSLFRLLRAQRIRVIETFTHHSNLIGCPLAWLAGVPVRVASHHGRLDRMPAWLQRLHAGMVNCGIASRLVAVSREVERQAVEEGVRPDRLNLILNGIRERPACAERAASLRTELLPETGSRMILSVGRLVSQKGHTYLLQAMPGVLESFPDAHAVLAGDGPLRAELEAEVDRLGIREHVRFLGTRPDVADLMAAADIFVLPSRSEGLPLALLEAMSAGLPVVVTEVPGVREALNNGRCGIIVPLEDPQALSAGLLRLLSNPALGGDLGGAARRRFLQEYTLDTMMQRYLNLLDSAVTPFRKEK